MNETGSIVTSSAHGTAAAQEPPYSNNSALDEAVSLLLAWNLPQLCEKFREQEVCTNALLYLTEFDIVELIPKIGPRAIFTARLREWRRAVGAAVGVGDAGGGSCPGSQQACKAGEQFQELLGAVKLEMGEADQHWLNDVSEQQPCQMTMTTGPGPVVAADSPMLMDSSPCKPALAQGELQFTTGNKQTLVNVRDILTNNLYGLKAIEYYQTHNELGALQRKKIVEIIIGTVMEQHIVMSAQCFMDLARQVNALFPAESIDIYYVPRIGLTCPKGALYNKYLNMGKALRRSGLLEYRVGRRAKHNIYANTP